MTIFDFNHEVIADRIAKRIREEFQEMSEPTFCVTKGIDPEKQHKEDAAYDLISCEATAVALQPYSSTLVKTGSFMAIPQGHVGLVCSRSGLALRRNIFVLNAPGVIDPSYRGEIGVILFNLDPAVYIVSPGDRIAQLLIVQTANVRLFNNPALFDKLDTERGEDGFGSTGRQ